MDNFRWLEEKEPVKKHQWLKHYWMHIAAAVVIVLLILYLVFNPGSSEPTNNYAGSLSENQESAVTSTAETTSKTITIRLPDKTIKQVNPEQPMLAQNLGNQPMSAENLSEISETPLSLNTNEQPPVEAASEQNTAAAAPEETPAQKPARISSRLIQPATSTNSQNLANIGEIPPKNPTPEVVQTPNTSIAPPVVVEQTTPSQAEELTLTPAETTNTATAAQTPPVAETTTPAAKKPSTVASAAAASKPPAAASTGIAPATSATANIHWLLQRDPTHYTMQLFGSASESAVQSFITQNNLTGKAVYAKMRQNNQDWFVVLMGDYANRNQAVGAISQLPANLQTQGPWARSMQSVQDDIRKRLAYGD